MIDPAALDQVIDRMHVKPADRILHLGVGDGAATRRLARLACSGLALGVDASDDNVRLARRLSVEIENVMFVLGSPAEIPWQENFFLAVLCSDPDWSRPEAAAREIFRVTSPGGRIFLVDPPPSSQSLLADAGFDAIQVRAMASGVLVEARKPQRAVGRASAHTGL